MPRRIKDISGRRFSHLVVLADSGLRGKNGGVIWSCRCDCGESVLIAGNDLNKWRPPQEWSCGCTRGSQIIHGLTGSPEHRIWSDMIYRCHNLNSQAYADYGGRGIQVCDEWRSDFHKFYEYIGARPEPHFSIDRIDNDGNYEPGNVRWATASEQARNRRKRKDGLFG